VPGPAAAAAPRGWKVSDEKTRWYYDQLSKNGMTIHKPSAQLATGLKKVGDTMLQDWLKKAGPEGQAVMDAYRKM
jgi:TRAP-type C4-dicarboxylate transport system substrate-binding protein